MLRNLLFAIALTAWAAAAEAQFTPTPYGPQMTAMGSLRQPPGQVGYRVAARNGVAAQSAAGQRPFKPYSNVTTTPTVSPYLNLFRDEAEGAIPNYHAFVQPQLQQQEIVRQQRRELDRLQRQVRQAGYNAPAKVAGGARFGDTGRFYSGWSR